MIVLPVSHPLALLAALPWVAIPVITAARMRGSPSLADESPAPPTDGPLVSVIIPARDEARNIARCATSVLASAYRPLEVVIVNDRSTDGTAAIAGALAERDPRLRVVDAPPLEEGWFGKQWACAQGAATARGTLLCFTDADTVHAPDLLPRAVNAVRARALDLLTVAGRQRVETFWERVVQPQLFALLALRYGGPRAVNGSRRAVDKIANGQFILVRRDAYDDVGGHAAVRAKVAEDLALAQLFFRRDKRTELTLGVGQLATRMYASLGELVGGWMKNIYAGALDAAPLGPLGRALLPLALLVGPAAELAPLAALGTVLAGSAGEGLFLWGAVASAVTLLSWLYVYARVVRANVLYAFSYPLGAMVLAWIVLRAVGRGRRVEWKGRRYVAE